MARKVPAKKPTKAAPKKAAPKQPAPKKVAKQPAKRPVHKGGPDLEKVAFTMFAVDDATRARAFYEDILGLTRGLSSPDGTWTEYDLPGGGCLALFRHPNPAFRSPPGGASIAFEVRDLDALDARLKAAGVAYQGERVHGPHCRMSNIRDTEGNGIILHELNK